MYMRERNGLRLGRITATLLLVALLGLGTSAGAQSITDVPPSHWAYEAVRDLIDRGYLALDEGHFRGDQPVDRFTLASTVARILYEIESGVVTPQSGSDVDLLRRVVNEYREDLVEAFARIEQNERTVGTTARELAATDETLTKVIDELARLQASLEAQLVAQSEAAERDHAALRASIDEQGASLQEQVHELRSLINELSAAVGERTDSVRAETATSQASLRSEILNLIAELREEHRQHADETEQRLASVSTQLNTLLKDGIDRIQGDLSALAEEVDALRFEADAALAEIHSQLNAQSEALAAQQIALEQQRASLEQRMTEHEGEATSHIESLAASHSELAARLDAMRADVDRIAGVTTRLDAMQSRLDSAERQLLALQSQIGLSEEQLAALRDHLMNELESQYQHSFLLSGNVSNELKALREEFNEYRQSTERNLSQARQAQTLGIIGAVLGLIGLMN